jgi:hypothetical protein
LLDHADADTLELGYHVRRNLRREGLVSIHPDLCAGDPGHLPDRLYVLPTAHLHLQDRERRELLRLLDGSVGFRYR